MPSVRHGVPIDHGCDDTPRKRHQSLQPASVAEELVFVALEEQVALASEDCDWNTGRPGCAGIPLWPLSKTVGSNGAQSGRFWMMALRGHVARVASPGWCPRLCHAWCVSVGKRDREAEEAHEAQFVVGGVTISSCRGRRNTVCVLGDVHSLSSTIRFASLVSSSDVNPSRSLMCFSLSMACFAPSFTA